MAEHCFREKVGIMLSLFEAAFG